MNRIYNHICSLVLNPSIRLPSPPPAAMPVSNSSSIGSTSCSSSPPLRMPVERSDLERAIRQNLHLIYLWRENFVYQTKFRDYPIILLIQVETIDTSWNEKNAWCECVDYLQFMIPSSLPATSAAPPTISLSRALSNESDTQPDCQLLQSAFDFLHRQPYSSTCAVYIHSQRECFKTPLIFLNFNLILPEIIAAGGRSLVHDIQLTTDDIIHRSEYETVIAKLMKSGLLLERSSDGITRFTNQFYQLKGSDLVVRPIQECELADLAAIVRMTEAAEFYSGDIRKLLGSTSAREGLVAILDGVVVGFSLFQSKKLDSICQLTIKYLFIDPNYRGLGSQLVNHVFNHIESRYPGCSIHCTTEVKTTDLATHFWLKKQGFKPCWDATFIEGIYQPAEKKLQAHPLSTSHNQTAPVDGENVAAAIGRVPDDFGAGGSAAESRSTGSSSSVTTSPSLPDVPAPRLYRDVLHTIFSFLELKAVVRACRVHPSWLAAGRTMKPREAELTLSAPISSLTDSSFRLHINRLTFVLSDVNDLVLIKNCMGHLDRLEVMMILVDHLSFSFPVPSQLRELSISVSVMGGSEVEDKLSTYFSEWFKQIAAQSTRLLKLVVDCLPSPGGNFACPQELRHFTTLTEIQLPESLNHKQTIDVIKQMPSLRVWNPSFDWRFTDLLQRLADHDDSTPQTSLEDIGRLIWVDEAMGLQLRRLTSLTKLNLGLVTIIDLTILLPQLPHLSVLKLICTKTVDINHLTTALSACGSLVDVHLDHPYLTSDHCSQFLPHLPALTCLSLVECDLTSLHFLTRARTSLVHLRTFELVRAGKLLIEYDHLRSIAPSLEYLTIDHSCAERWNDDTIARWTPGSSQFRREEWPLLKQFTFVQPVQLESMFPNILGQDVF